MRFLGGELADFGDMRRHAATQECQSITKLLRNKTPVVLCTTISVHGPASTYRIATARALCGDSKRFWRLCPCRCAFSLAIHPSILVFRFIPIVQFSVYPPHFHIVSCLRRAATCCLVPHKHSNQHCGVVCIVCVSHSELMMTSTAHEHREFSLSVLHSAVPSYRSYGIFSHSQSPPSLLHSIFSSTI